MLKRTYQIAAGWWADEFAKKAGREQRGAFYDSLLELLFERLPDCEVFLGMVGREPSQILVSTAEQGGISLDGCLPPKTLMRITDATITIFRLERGELLHR